MFFTNFDFYSSLNLSSMRMFENNCVLPRKRFYGQIDDLEKNFMFNFVREICPKSIVEFSTSHGYSTAIIASSLKSRNIQSNFKTYEIDLKSFALAFNNLDSLELYGINMIVGDVLSTMDEKTLDDADFLFIDSDHRREFCYSYVDSFFPHLKKDCCVAVHDIWFDPINDETSLIVQYLKDTNNNKYFFIRDLLEMYSIESKEPNGTLWF